MTDFPHPHPGFETIERIMPFIHLEKQILPFSFKGQFSRILIKSFIRHSELPSSVLRQSVQGSKCTLALGVVSQGTVNTAGV